jgi:hypothetical protein
MILDCVWKAFIGPLKSKTPGSGERLQRNQTSTRGVYLNGAILRLTLKTQGGNNELDENKLEEAKC